jgi:hypothetical protein
MDFVKTYFMDRKDFIIVRYLVTNNGLPSNTDFIPKVM